MRVTLLLASVIALWSCGSLLFTDGPFIGNGTDMISSKIPRHALLHSALLEGRVPLWDPSILGGAPFAAGVPGYLTPNIYLTALLETSTDLKLSIVLHTVGAAMGAAWWVSRKTTGVAAPLLAASVFALSGFFAAHLFAGHLRMVAAVAYLPWLLGSCERAIERAPRGLATAALLCGGMLLTGHYAINYIALWGVGLYVVSTALFEAPRGSRVRTLLRACGVLFVVVGLGVGLSMVLTLPGVETVSLSHRHEPTLEFNASYASAPANLLGLVWPHLYGDSVNAPFFGDWSQHEAFSFFGVVGLCLVVWAPQRLGWRRSAPALLVMLFGGVLSLGLATPFFEWFVTWVPKASSFRSPGRWGLLVIMAGSVLSARVLSDFQRRDHARAPWPVLSLAALCVLFSLWLLSLDSEAFARRFSSVASVRASTWLTQVGWQQNLELAHDEAWRAAATAALVALAVWFGRKPERRGVAALALVLLSVVELGEVGRRFLITGHDQHTSWDPRLVDYLQTRRYPGMRVMVDRRLHTSGRLAPLGISEVGGYSSSASGQYFRLLNAADGYSLDSYVAYPHIRRNGPLLSRLGAHYLLSARPQPEPWSHQSLQGYADWTFVARFGDVYLYENPRPQPRAFLSRRARVLPERETLQQLAKAEFDMRSEALLSETPPEAVQRVLTSGAPHPADSVHVERFESDRVELRVHAEEPALLLLSDNWHPGWSADVDGQEVPVVQANQFMRALPVPGGDHRVTMVFRPETLRRGALISGLCLVGVLALGWLARRYELRVGARLGE